MEESLAARAVFAVRNLRRLAGTGPLPEVWVSVPDPAVTVTTLPDVRDADLDAVAVLNASRTSPVDPETTAFDYRVVAEEEKNGAKVKRAVALAAPKEAVEALREAFAEAGVELTGSTTRRLAAPGLLMTGAEACEWANYAILEINPEASVLTIMQNGVPALQRAFNFGLVQMMSDAIAELSLTDEERPNETAAARHRRLEEDAKHLFADRSINPAMADRLAAALEANVERALKYLERTLGYYDRVEQGAAPEGILVVAAHGIVEEIVRAVTERTGLPCRKQILESVAGTDTEEGVLAARCNFKSSALVDAAGMALADNRLPNLLDPPAERRARARMRTIVRAASAAIAVLACGAIAFAGWCGLEHHRVSAELEAVRGELAQIAEPMTPELLATETAALTQLETRAFATLQRRRFASILSTVAGLRPDELFVRSIEFAPEGDPAEQKSKTTDRRRSKNRDRAAQPEAPKSLLAIRATAYGSAQDRETAMAQFISRLESAAPGATLTVARDEADKTGYTYLIRLKGGF